MNQFYTGLIFTGMAMIITSLIWVLADWRRTKLNLSAIDQKKQELQSIMEDADQMIQELNRLSDYILLKVEEKNDILNQTLSKFQLEMVKYSTISGEKLVQPNEKFNISNENDEFLGENQDMCTGKPDTSKEENTIESETLIAENVLQQKSSSVTYKQAKKLYEISRKPVEQNVKPAETQVTVKDHLISSKLVNMNPKYKKIISLSQKGLSDIEIAKHLNMGRGEIQLILEMHR